MLLIDCYNLLHTPMPLPLAGLDEARLVALLASGGGKAARVVCDGVEKPHAPTSLSVGEVELLYAGPGRSADDVIIEMIDADSTPRKLVVVSNDRQIQKAASRRRAKAMTCERFIGTLAKLASRRGRLSGHTEGRTGDAKPTPIGDTNYWLREFGLAGADDTASPVTGRTAATPRSGSPHRAILWTRRDIPGVDAARLISTPTGHDLTGVALFVHDDQPVRLDYHVHCNAAFITEHAAVRGHVGAASIDLTLTADARRRWTLNRQRQPQLDGCVDLDLAFTPATNLIAIRRMARDRSAPHHFRGAWLQWPSLELTPLEQHYRKTGEGYRYDAPKLKFTADLRTNDVGFVTHYADLWEMVAQT